MSNVDQNGQNVQGTDLSKVNKMFKDYKNTSSGNNKNGYKKLDILSKIFVPRKDKEYFRILPPLDGRDYVENVFFHEIEVNTPKGKKYRKIYCPSHNNPKVPKMEDGKQVMDKNGNPVMIPDYCPLCEKYKTEISKQDNSLRGVKKEDYTDEQKKIREDNDKIYRNAVRWQAKKFYIVRGIDKGSRKDGVKFWRFKHNFKKQGVLDKLIPALSDYVEMNGDFSDPNTGTDLSITVDDVEFPGTNGTRTYRGVIAISSRGASKLSDDDQEVKEWLEDTITWREVFKAPKAPKIDSTKYLELIVEGNDPYWDDTDDKKKKWVFPNNPELEEAANTRDQNLDADKVQEIEMASDIKNGEVVEAGENVALNKTSTTDDSQKNEQSEDNTEDKDETSNESSTDKSDTNTENDETSNDDDYEDTPDDLEDDLPF